MSLIREHDRQALRDLAEGMKEDVSLTLYTQSKSPLIVPGVIPCETCEVTEQLLTELDTLMPRVNVTIADLVRDRKDAAQSEVDRVPTIVLGGSAGNRARFVGFPGGYEFPAFLRSVLELGGAEPGLDAKTTAKLAEVKKPVDIKVFVTPT